jgi:hypothetical protein
LNKTKKCGVKNVIDLNCKPHKDRTLRSIGITPAGMETDIATGEEMANLQAPGAEGGLPGPPAGGVGGTIPGVQAPAASPAGL